MGAMTPDGPAADPSAAEHRRSRRFPLSTVLVALVVATGAGVGTFALQGGFAGAATSADASTTAPVGTVGQSVECGPVARCVPSLRSSDVVGALQAKGFWCEQTAGAWSCDLPMGPTSFSLQLSPPAGEDETMIERINASVILATESSPNDQVVPYLTWAAALPFGKHPAGSQVRQFARQQIEGGNDARARIGGYTYAVIHKRISGSRRSIRLEIDPVMGFEDQLLGDS